jgi:hypothetical protein
LKKIFGAVRRSLHSMIDAIARRPIGRERGAYDRRSKNPEKQA